MNFYRKLKEVVNAKGFYLLPYLITLRTFSLLSFKKSF